MKPIILIAIGIIYAVMPDFFPGPIDDIIVNIITTGLALKGGGTNSNSGDE